MPFSAEALDHIWRASISRLHLIPVRFAAGRGWGNLTLYTMCTSLLRYHFYFFTLQNQFRTEKIITLLHFRLRDCQRVTPRRLKSADAPAPVPNSICPARAPGPSPLHSVSSPLLRNARTRSAAAAGAASSSPAPRHGHSTPSSLRRRLLPLPPAHSAARPRLRTSRCPVDARRQPPATAALRNRSSSMENVK